jgi:hypothetical protein
VEGFVVALGIGMLVMAVVKPIAALDLRDNGIRTSAFVQGVQQSGKNTDYEVSFPLQDGTAFTEWTGNLDSGTQVGDTIQIAYLAGSPSTLEDVRELGRWWAAPVVFGPVGIFFVLFGWTMWRGSPESFTRALRARYGGR